MSGNPRFDGTASDKRFFFNGQPLVRLCTVPDPDADTDPDTAPNACLAGEAQPSWANGWPLSALDGSPGAVGSAVASVVASRATSTPTNAIPPRRRKDS
jgi:hypothetical protein